MRLSRVRSHEQQQEQQRKREHLRKQWKHFVGEVVQNKRTRTLKPLV